MAAAWVGRHLTPGAGATGLSRALGPFDLGDPPPTPAHACLLKAIQPFHPKASPLWASVMRLCSFPGVQVTRSFQMVKSHSSRPAPLTCV